MIAIKELSIHYRILLVVLLLSCTLLPITACSPATIQPSPPPTPVPAAPPSQTSSPSPLFTSYLADYQISLTSVERPENSLKRYGPQKITPNETLGKYSFSFEDKLVRILWFVSSTAISFKIHNKSNKPIGIPWEEAAYVDEQGQSHRIMHAGIKYVNRDKHQPSSVIARKSFMEDMIYPTDYVSWVSGLTSTTGHWSEQPLLLSIDFHSQYSSGKYSSITEFEKAVTANVGKQIKVALPLRVNKTIYHYIFVFSVTGATVSSKVRKALF